MAEKIVCDHEHLLWLVCLYICFYCTVAVIAKSVQLQCDIICMKKEEGNLIGYVEGQKRKGYH